MTVIDSIDVDGGILVAHDGSAAATAALQTAARIAPAFGNRLTVVRAWSVTTAPAPPDLAPGYMPPLDDFAASTLAALDRDVAPVVASHPDVAVTTSVVHGNVAVKLIEASAHVDLIVVGSRGRGGFAGLLLGSVSDQVVHHARCGVLVDRGARPAVTEEPAGAEDLERALLSELKLDDPGDA